MRTGFLWAQPVRHNTAVSRNNVNHRQFEWLDFGKIVELRTSAISKGRNSTVFTSVDMSRMVY